MKTLALRARVFIHCFLVFGYPGETLNLATINFHLFSQDMGRLAGAWRGSSDGKGPSPASIRDIFSRLPSGPGPRGPPGKPGKPGAQVRKYHLSTIKIPSSL